VAWIHLAELLPFLMLLFLLTSQWGVLGAALAWTIRAVVDMGLLGYKSGAWEWQTPIFLVSFCLITISAVLSYEIALNLYYLMGVGGACLTITLLWSWRMGLGGYIRALTPRVFTI